MRPDDPAPGERVNPNEESVPDPTGPDPKGLDPKGLDPKGLDPKGLDPKGLDPTGLGLARALAGELAARSRQSPGRPLSRAALAGRAEAAGLPLAPGAGTSPQTSRPGTRYRPPPRATGRVGGLAGPDPFTGPGADPADPRELATEIERVLEGVGGRARVAVHALFAQWPDLVGTDVAAHSRPTGFVDGMLQVSADSSAWATQLRLLGPTICATLDQRLGAGTVAGIVVSGPARPSWRHGAFGLRDARGPRDTYG